jgi:hypothetical protein
MTYSGTKSEIQRHGVACVPEPKNQEKPWSPGKRPGLLTTEWRGDGGWEPPGSQSTSAPLSRSATAPNIFRSIAWGSTSAYVGSRTDQRCAPEARIGVSQGYDGGQVAMSFELGGSARRTADLSGQARVITPRHRTIPKGICSTNLICRNRASRSPQGALAIWVVWWGPEDRKPCNCRGRFVRRGPQA